MPGAHVGAGAAAVHSLKVVPSSGWRGLMPTSHTSATPAGGTMGSLQALRIVDGRLERAIGATDEAHERRDGAQMRHHLRKKITSAAINTGMMSTDQVTSPPPNSAISRNTRANERPTGHEAKHRKPEDGRGKQGAAQDDVARIGRLAVGAGGACACAGGFQARFSAPEGRGLPIPFLKMPRSLLHTGTGHSHPQKARPKSRMAATASTMEMTARGTEHLAGEHGA